MTMTILSINISMTVMFTLMKHPLSMGMILLIQTTLISMMTSTMNQTSWFSYILFLVMIGGMLILFMYMTSVASNEKFKPNNKLASIMMIAPITFMVTKNLTNSFITNNETEKTLTDHNMNMTMNKFINFPLSMILLFLMVYLLMALIATVKITEFKQGPIRQMN